MGKIKLLFILILLTTIYSYSQDSLAKRPISVPYINFIGTTKDTGQIFPKSIFYDTTLQTLWFVKDKYHKYNLLLIDSMYREFGTNTAYGYLGSGTYNYIPKFIIPQKNKAVPKMTTDSIFECQVYTSGTFAYKAFSKDVPKIYIYQEGIPCVPNSTEWTKTDPDTTFNNCYILIKFRNQKCISNYTIQLGYMYYDYSMWNWKYQWYDDIYYLASYAQDWVLYGSNDMVNWIKLDSVVNQDFGGQVDTTLTAYYWSPRYTYYPVYRNNFTNIENIGAYYYYKINFKNFNNRSSTVGNSLPYYKLVIQYIQLYEGANINFADSKLRQSVSNDTVYSSEIFVVEKDLYSNGQIISKGNKIKFLDNDKYLSLEAYSPLSNNFQYILPNYIPTTGQYLKASTITSGPYYNLIQLGWGTDQYGTSSTGGNVYKGGDTTVNKITKWIDGHTITGSNFNDNGSVPKYNNDTLLTINQYRNLSSNYVAGGNVYKGFDTTVNKLTKWINGHTIIGSNYKDIGIPIYGYDTLMTLSQFRSMYSGGQSVGEANTASNLGGTYGLYKEKVGVDLRFKGITPGSNVSIIDNGNYLTINAAGSGITGREIKSAILPLTKYWDTTIMIKGITGFGSPGQVLKVSQDGQSMIWGDDNVLLSSQVGTVFKIADTTAGYLTKWYDGHTIQGSKYSETSLTPLWNNDTLVRNNYWKLHTHSGENYKLAFWYNNTLTDNTHWNLGIKSPSQKYNWLYSTNPSLISSYYYQVWSGNESYAWNIGMNLDNNLEFTYSVGGNSIKFYNDGKIWCKGPNGNYGWALTTSDSVGGGGTLIGSGYSSTLVKYYSLWTGNNSLGYKGLYQGIRDSVTLGGSNYTIVPYLTPYGDTYIRNGFGTRYYCRDGNYWGIWGSTVPNTNNLLIGYNGKSPILVDTSRNILHRASILFNENNVYSGIIAAAQDTSLVISTKSNIVINKNGVISNVTPGINANDVAVVGQLPKLEIVGHSGSYNIINDVFKIDDTTLQFKKYEMVFENGILKNVNVVKPDTIRLRNVQITQITQQAYRKPSISVQQIFYNTTSASASDPQANTNDEFYIKVINNNPFETNFRIELNDSLARVLVNNPEGKFTDYRQIISIPVRNIKIKPGENLIKIILLKRWAITTFTGPTSGAISSLSNTISFNLTFYDEYNLVTQERLYVTSNIIQAPTVYSGGGGEDNLQQYDLYPFQIYLGPNNPLGCNVLSDLDGAYIMMEANDPTVVLKIGDNIIEQHDCQYIDISTRISILAYSHICTPPFICAYKVIKYKIYLSLEPITESNKNNPNKTLIIEGGFMVGL